MKTNKVKYKGEIELVGVKVPCYVLEDGTRVLPVQGIREILKKIGVGDIERKSGEKLKQHLKQNSSEILIYNEDKKKKSSPIIGYEATALEDLFDIYLKVMKRGAKLLSPNQRMINNQCEMLLRSFTRVGIISLIDEATGYQYEKERSELQRIIRTYTLSTRAFKILSKNKEGFFEYLKEKYSLASSETADEASKEEFDEALKVLLNATSRKRKQEIKKKNP